MNIINWDYVLGANNQKVPIITFKPNFETLSASNFNNQRVWVTLDKTGKECLDGESFQGIVDRSTVTNPCPADMSYETPLWTLTLQCAPFFEGIKGGVFTLNKQVTPEYAAPLPPSPETKKYGTKEQTKPPTAFKFGGVELSLLASLAVTIAILIIVRK